VAYLKAVDQFPDWIIGWSQRPLEQAWIHPIQLSIVIEPYRIRIQWSMLFASGLNHQTPWWDPDQPHLSWWYSIRAEN
jgi:hypothetical protein